MMHLEAGPAVLLEGDGMAAVCVARLLTDAGVQCAWQPNARPKLAAILLGEQTQHLLRELFPASEEAAGDLFADFVQIRRRVVLWGDAAEPLELPHRGVVAPEGELLRRLWERVPAMVAVEGLHGEVACRVQTSRATVADRPELNVGHRHASFALAELHDGIVADACWVESVARGWLFLLALGDGKATLIAVGDTPASLLAESRLVSQQIAGSVAPIATVPAYPRLTNTLADADGILCGSAAMSFDPLCGEGAGNAVREAFLAAAVVRASLNGMPRGPLGEHYTDRLRRGFMRHLEMCLQFYSTGGTGEFWRAEAASLLAGLQELQPSVEREPTHPFRLVDRNLQPLQLS